MVFYPEETDLWKSARLWGKGQPAPRGGGLPIFLSIALSMLSCFIRQMVDHAPLWPIQCHHSCRRVPRLWKLLCHLRHGSVCAALYNFAAWILCSQWQEGNGIGRHQWEDPLWIFSLSFNERNYCLLKGLLVVVLRPAMIQSFSLNHKMFFKLKMFKYILPFCLMYNFFRIQKSVSRWNLDCLNLRGRSIFFPKKCI